MFTGSFNLAFTTCVENRNFAWHARYKNYLLERDEEKLCLGKNRNAPNFDFEKVIDSLALSMIYYELQKDLNKVPHDRCPLKARSRYTLGRAW